MGRSVLITGGMSGIGLAIAGVFVGAGDRVSIVDTVESEQGRGLVDSSEGAFWKADVRNFQRAEEVVNAVVSLTGRLDVLVNCAGINRDAMLWKMTEEAWDDVVTVDLKGTFNYLRAAASIMRTQQGGKIVNVASINGLRGKAGLANYGAAKAGVVALTRVAARELGRSNVNVNGVAPGFVETPMMARLAAEIREQAVRETALGRIGRPEEIADVIFFLCSDQARHITGQTIVVDGGQTA